MAGGINAYTYVFSNPLRLIDPSGMDPEDVQIAQESLGAQPGNWNAEGQYVTAYETFEIHEHLDELDLLRQAGTYDYLSKDEWAREDREYRKNFGFDTRSISQQIADDLNAEFNPEAYKADVEARRKYQEDRGYAEYRSGKLNEVYKGERRTSFAANIAKAIGVVTVVVVTGGFALEGGTALVGTESVSEGLSLGGVASESAGVANVAAGGGTVGAASESGALLEAGGSGIVRGGGVISVEVAGGGGVLAETGAEAALAETGMSAGTAAAFANASAANAWFTGMLEATRDVRFALPTIKEQADAFRSIVLMRDLLYFR